MIRVLEGRPISQNRLFTPPAPTELPRQSLPPADPFVPLTPPRPSPAPELRCRSSAPPPAHCRQVPLQRPTSLRAPPESPRMEFCSAPAHSGSSAETPSDH